MLTDKQQKIIDDLKSEFTKINTPAPTSSGGLINRALIDKKFEDAKKRKAEIEAINKSTAYAIQEMMDKDLDRLNKDLIPMGMAATKESSSSPYINFGAYDKPSSFYIEYCSTSDYETLADGSGMSIRKGFGYIKYYDTWSSYSFTSIDALCKSKDFIKRIEGIYLQILKDKN
jgi:hypothetical protein